MGRVVSARHFEHSTTEKSLTVIIYNAHKVRLTLNIQNEED